MKCQPRAAKSTMTESRQQCCCSSSLVLVSTLIKLFRFRIIRVVTIQVVTIQITAILVSLYDLGQMFRCGELFEERRRRSRSIFAPSGSCRVLGQDCLTLYLETQNFAPRLVITVYSFHLDLPYVLVTLCVCLFFCLSVCSYLFNFNCPSFPTLFTGRYWAVVLGDLILSYNILIHFSS